MASKKSTNKNIVKKENSSDNGYFKVSLDTFLYNAGIVGFIEVLEEAGAEKGSSGARVSERTDRVYLL